MEEFDELQIRINDFVSGSLWDIVTSRDDSKIKLEKIIEEISKFFNIKRCSLMIGDEFGNFSVIASEGLSGKVVRDTRVQEGDGSVVGMVLREKVAVFIKKIKEIEVKEHESEYQTDNFISYPIFIEGKIFAVLNLTDKRDDRGFTERDIETIKPIIERLKFVLESL